MLGAYNVTDTPRHVPVEVLHELGLAPDLVVDRITGAPPRRHGDSPDHALAAPYAALWLT